MSDKIPVEIQMEIIQRIPDIRSVIQLRSVSKSWKSMVDSEEFVTGHTLRHFHQQPHRLLISGKDSGDSQQVKYVSIIDNDDTFPHQKFNLFVPDICKDARLVGSSHGLLCLYDYKRNIAVIWNPLIRKTVFTTVVTDEFSKLCRIDVGFGVCDDTLDPKIVKIPYDSENANPNIGVEVFTWSLGVWRSPISSTAPRKSVGLGFSQAVVDGCIYWDAFDDVDVDGVNSYQTLVISFDLTSEMFTELYLPNPSHGDLFVSNLRDSLGVVEYDCYSVFVFYIWIMKGCGYSRTFEKLYNITPSDASINMTLGFRMSGAPIVEMLNDKVGLPVTLATYEPESKDITEIWRDGVAGTFFVHPYMETLLLLGH